MYQHENYRDFILAQIDLMPDHGRGIRLKLSRALRLHTSTLSQILSSQRGLSPEHGTQVAEFFGLSPAESKYFLFLIQRESAGSQVLRDFWTKELAALRAKATELVNVVHRDKVLSPEQKSIFYSNWYYSGIRVLTSIPGHETADAIARKIGIPIRLVHQALAFLVESGLIVPSEDGYAPGARYTHLESGSPLVSNHHRNWRGKAMERHPCLDEPEIAYTSPMSLSHGDARSVRALLVELIDRVNKLRDRSPCEAAYCLNIDWTQFTNGVAQSAASGEPNQRNGDSDR